MLVKVKGKGVKLSGKWCYKNEEAEINEVEYEENKEYLDIVKEDKNTPEIPQIPGPDDKDDEELKLKELRAKAKELGIRNSHLMGKEKLEELIAEKAAPMFGTKTDENNEEDDAKLKNTDENPESNDGDNGKDNPQE